MKQTTTPEPKGRPVAKRRTIQAWEVDVGEVPYQCGHLRRYFSRKEDAEKWIREEVPAILDSTVCTAGSDYDGRFQTASDEAAKAFAPCRVEIPIDKAGLLRFLNIVCDAD